MNHYSASLPAGLSFGSANNLLYQGSEENQVGTMSRWIYPQIAHLKIQPIRNNFPCLNSSLQRQRIYQSVYLDLESSSLWQRQRSLSRVFHKHQYSTTRPAFAVHVTNPRQDDDGNAKVIDITSRASKVGVLELRV